LAFVLHALPILSSLTWLFWSCLAMSTSYEAHSYAAFSNLLSLPAVSVYIAFSSSHSQTHSFFLPNCQRQSSTSIQSRKKTTVLYILILTLIAHENTKDFGLNVRKRYPNSIFFAYSNSNIKTKN
jgi:hypothetical protein